MKDRDLRAPRKLVIAVDGPAGSGKSTTARALADRLGIRYIDSGAMYRALTLKALREGVSLEDPRALVRLARRARIRLSGTTDNQKVHLDGRDVTKAIRTSELTRQVFHVAQVPAVRRQMVRLQRRMARGPEGAVMEGRDIGTVVFPKADYKFFFTASLAVRAERRRRELAASGQRLTRAQVAADVRRRDATDRNRSEGPLRQAKGAIRLDTTKLTIPQTVERMVGIILRREAAGRV